MTYLLESNQISDSRRTFDYERAAGRMAEFPVLKQEGAQNPGNLLYLGGECVDLAERFWSRNLSDLELIRLVFELEHNYLGAKDRETALWTNILKEDIEMGLGPYVALTNMLQDIERVLENHREYGAQKLIRSGKNYISSLLNTVSPE